MARNPREMRAGCLSLKGRRYGGRNRGCIFVHIDIFRDVAICKASVSEKERDAKLIRSMGD